MPPATTSQLLDREFLQIRAQVLSLAASLDRLDRSTGPSDDARLSQLRSALSRLVDPSPDRAAAVQLLFSDSYDSSWRDRFELSPR